VNTLSSKNKLRIRHETLKLTEQTYLNIPQKWWDNSRVRMRMPIWWKQVPSRMWASKAPRK